MRRLTSILVLLLALPCSCAKSGKYPTAPTPTPTPRCALSVSSINFGSVTTGSHRDTTFTVTNSGGGTLAGSVSASCTDFTILGTSSFSLGAGQAASFGLRFGPSQSGARSCTVHVGDGCSLACTGTGLPAGSADCGLSPSSLDFGSVPVGQSLDRVFTVTNTGSSTLSGSVTSPCAEFSLPGHHVYSLAPGKSDTVIVRFSPTSPASKSCQLAVGGSCGSLSCTGSGQEDCVVSPRSIDFGQVRYGSARDTTFTVTNAGTSLLTGTIPVIHVLGFSLVGSGTYNLGPGQSARFTIEFAPTITHTGSYGGDVDLGTLCGTLQVSGSGTFGCDCQLSTIYLDFGNVTVGVVSPIQTFTIRNSSDNTITGAVRVLQGEFQAPSNYAAAPGVGQQLWADFAPTRTGAQVGKIIFDRNGCTGPGQPCDTLICTGTGVLASPPLCGISTNTIDMGTVYFGTYKDTTFTIRNVGGGTLADSIKFLGNSPPFYAFTSHYALGPGDSVSARIRFVSSGLPGHVYSYVGDLFTGSQCMAQGLGVQVTAVAKEAPSPPPICSAAPDTLNFGNVLLGHTMDLSFQVKNVGGSVLAGQVSVPCSDFALVGSTSQYVLGGGQSATFTVRFTPTSVGAKQCWINPGGGCAWILALGNGQ